MPKKFWMFSRNSVMVEQDVKALKKSCSKLKFLILSFRSKISKHSFVRFKRSACQRKPLL